MLNVSKSLEFASILIAIALLISAGYLSSSSVAAQLRPQSTTNTTEGVSGAGAAPTPFRLGAITIPIICSTTAEVLQTLPVVNDTTGESMEMTEEIMMELLRQQIMSTTGGGLGPATGNLTDEELRQTLDFVTCVPALEPPTTIPPAEEGATITVQPDTNSSNVANVTGTN